MKLWLTRCYGGRYLLTAMKPLISPIRGFKNKDGSSILDAFERVGEPIAVRYLCEGGIRSLMGKDFPYLVPTKIEISAKELDLLAKEEMANKDVDGGADI